MDGNGRPPQYPHAHNDYHLHFDPDQPSPQHSHPQSHHTSHLPHHTPLPSSSSPLPQSVQDANAWSYDYSLHQHPHTASPTSYHWQPQPTHFVSSVPSDVAQQAHHQYIQQQYSTPSSAPFHSPRSQSFYINPVAPSPYAYHATSHPSAYPSPISRSMSAGAVSSPSLEQLSSTQARQQVPQSNNTFLPTPRQIRFVSTDGQPHAKRRRINAACLTCRKRKTRCSGERPVCKTCTDNGHKCAGYADKLSKKDPGKKPDDGFDDDEGDSPPSSPRKQRPDSTSAAQRGGSTSFGTQTAFETQGYPLTQVKTRSVPCETLGDIKSPVSNHTIGSGSALTGRARVPFFRYFGPTAIVPGFKQMVVQMKEGAERKRAHNKSVSSDSSAPGLHRDTNFSMADEVVSANISLPYYNAADPSPNAPLITHLCETFFTHLGCNYPFLQREQFLQDLEDKRVDAILVNAVCAVAARFSSDLSLSRPSDNSLPMDSNGNVRRAFRGQPYAQRAVSAVIDTFSCPTLAVTQACLLLAYEEFGSDRDSGLWMYLGTSIRMAQDLGISKLQGLQLEGRLGPTPKTAKLGEAGKREEVKRADQQSYLSRTVEMKDGSLLDDRRASEQERIDTFWAVFFLDRAVSSGVGRPVTIRDEDIEISFPYRASEAKTKGHPDPFPAMIRIVHMYGRVADVLNNIKEVSEVTPQVLRRLADMEKDLTGIYQKLSSKLHFNATNFQHHVKAGHGTNFILLHFWFHTLIVLLHQPTLLHSFEGRIQQLFSDSRELSMSSAKTIADILAFAELIDVKSFIGNPFTSQPMYVAACAFLAEAAAHVSQPLSRRDSPFENKEVLSSKTGRSHDVREAEQRIAAKHSLLASAANQNYQRCYKALKTLDSYWAGCRYILVALDQKSKGLASPLLFTSDDVDGEMPSTEPSFTTPGWRRSAFGVSIGGPAFDKIQRPRDSSQDLPWSPKMDMSNAIGWSITGTANSPAPNLSFLYQNLNSDLEQDPKARAQQSTRAQIVAPTDQHVQVPVQAFSSPQNFHPSSVVDSRKARNSSLPYDPVSTAEADLLLGLHSPYSGVSPAPAASTSNTIQTQSQMYGRRQGTPLQPPYHQTAYYQNSAPAQFADMFIESQEVDMSNQENFNVNNFGFPGGDMIPWLEYLPQDVLNYFGDSDEADLDVLANGVEAHGGLLLPSGPGPPQDHLSLGSGGCTTPARK